MNEALEAAALRELRKNYVEMNASYFGDALKPAVMRLVDSRARLGAWRHDDRTIEISRALLFEQGWGSVIEVLKHEMAHQYVDEVLRRHDEPAHGPAFRELCARHGFDSRASGVPAAAGNASPVLGRIAKLLALAGSANPHEAEAAMKAAQRLMLKHNLEPPTVTDAADYGFMHVGRATGRVSEAERIVAAILGEFFFVDPIWVPVWRPREGKRGSVLEIGGRRDNLEMAAYVHAFLLRTADDLWSQQQAQGRARRERRAFLAGVMNGFSDKLRRERRSQEATGLVWAGDPGLRKYMRRRHPYTRSVRSASSTRAEAHREGRKAGRGIVLHRPVTRGASNAPPRLLPSG
jgi:hypothetical protein